MLDTRFLHLYFTITILACSGNRSKLLFFFPPFYKRARLHECTRTHTRHMYVNTPPSPIHSYKDSLSSNLYKCTKLHRIDKFDQSYSRILISDTINLKSNSPFRASPKGVQRIFNTNSRRRVEAKKKPHFTAA